MYSKRNSNKIFKVAFDETKTKVIRARISKVDSSGVLYVNEREGSIDKKVNIESDDLFELFREYRESKANPNFNRTTVYVKMFSTSIIFDLLCVPLLLEGRKE